MKILSRSLSREFRNDALGLRCDPSSTVVHESDLGHLPPVVGAYLLRAGVVGRPRVSSFHAVFHGRIRSAPDKPWLSGGVEQWSFYEPETRLFFMRARLAGLPFHVYHRSDDDAASMRVGLFGRFEIVDASGPELTQAEAVTRLNDRCLLAPATLIDPRLRWQTLDERRVRVSHEHAGRTVSAELSFDPNGDLSGFVSHDRYQSDGRSHRLVPWSTPVTSYASFGSRRLMKTGEARWLDANGEWTYAELTLDGIEYNLNA